MSNVTIINIEMLQQGPQGEPGNATIDDTQVVNNRVWSSLKTYEEIQLNTLILSIAFSPF